MTAHAQYSGPARRAVAEAAEGTAAVESGQLGAVYGAAQTVETHERTIGSAERAAPVRVTLCQFHGRTTAPPWVLRERWT